MKYVRTWFLPEQSSWKKKSVYFVEIGDDGWMTREIELDDNGAPLEKNVEFGCFDAYPFEMPDDQIEVIDRVTFEAKWNEPLASRPTRARFNAIGWLKRLLRTNYEG